LIDVNVNYFFPQSLLIRIDEILIKNFNQITQTFLATLGIEENSVAAR
jgi:hypothetical protein